MMTKYHFHIHNSTGFIEDEDGVELDGLDAVRSEAIKGVRSLLSGEVMQGRMDLRGRLEIVDGDGTAVLTLPFAEAVELYMD